MSGKVKKKGQSIDDLVQYVTLHKAYPVAFSGVVWPFIILYLLCLMFIFQSDDDYYEIGFIVIFGIAFVHVLTSLCCYWSVHISAFLNCRKVRIKISMVT